MRNWKPIAFLLLAGVFGLMAGMGMFGAFVVNPGAEISVALATSTMAPSASAIPSPTVTPSPFVDYQATEFAVRLTEVSVNATDAHDQRKHDLEMEAYRWLGVTGTVAVTSMAQTATAVSDQATATQQAEAIFLARETAIAFVPTQMVAMANSAAEAEFARLDAFARVIAFCGMAWVTFAIGLFLMRPILFKAITKPEPTQPVLPRVNETPSPPRTEAMNALAESVSVRLTEDTGSFMTAWMYTVPASAEMLTEFADGIVSGNKTTAFDYWEGRESLWTRKTYSKFRGWFCQKEFFSGRTYAMFTENGEMIVLEDGMRFLRGWLDGRELPEKFEFGNVTSEMQIIIPNTQKLLISNHIKKGA
jgi:hypothetical protein